MVSAQDLHNMAQRLRADTLQMVYGAQAGHVAGPLSCADLMAVLYFGQVVNHDRDKIVLSCGHYCPVLYSAIARSGGFPISELKTFMQVGGRLPGHPERGMTPGVEVSSGPLGQGVSVAVGMALGLKLRYGYKARAETPRIYCILSDGEIQEGQVYEAFNFAVRRQLDNLIFIVDRNGIQIENYVSQLATYGDMAARFEAFGLHTLEVDGYDIESLTQTIERAKNVAGGPVLIVMHTVAGQGVSFMEHDPSWHDKVPTKKELAKALQELGVDYD